MSRRLIYIGITWAILCIVAVADLRADDAANGGDEIQVRTSVDPSEGAVVGQRVKLLVDVLAQDGWAKVKRANDFSVPGTQVVRYETQGTRLNETIGGRSYTGQRYQISLFPRQGGTVTVPAIAVEVEVTRWGSSAGKEVLKRQTLPVSFKVQVPPGAENIKGLISTTALTATQTWAPKQQQFKVGEAIKRTIELSGKNISGMAFTPLQFDTSEKVSVYPAEPQVNDHYDRGTLTGRRTETVTYVFAREGDVELPEIIVPWWDIEKQQLQKSVLPAMELEIAPSPTAHG